MNVWQLQEAKQKLSRLVDRAISEGPQIITRHGAEAAVVLSVAAYRRLTAQARPSLKRVLLESAGADRDGFDLGRVLPRRGDWLRKMPEALPD